ncbi:MAG: Mut7-C RNAse domain-containing protein [Thermoplasmata archaeon]
MKFITDHMLGRLAKYLRLLGYDTLYPDYSMDDNSIIDMAKSEGRILITRDKLLYSKYRDSILIKSENYMEQLREVNNKIGLKTENMLSRCSVCNVPLEKIDKENVRGKVPENVFNTHDVFFICPKCKRVYWMGTHTKKIIETFREVLGIEDRGDQGG